LCLVLLLPDGPLFGLSQPQQAAADRTAAAHRSAFDATDANHDA